jgi:hypothetical protein
MLTGMAPAAHAAGEEPAPCTEDAMLVFDASGPMSGNGWGYGSENPAAVSRIEKVRAALAKILPSITRLRRVGLITTVRGPASNATSGSSSARPRMPPPRSWWSSIGFHPPAKHH